MSNRWLVVCAALLLTACDSAARLERLAARDACLSGEIAPAEMASSCAKVIGDPDASDQQRINARFNLALAQGRLENLDASLATVNELLQLKPDYTKALTMRGYLHLQRQNPEAALHDFEAAAGLAPEDAELLANLAIGFGEVGKQEQALEYTQRALALRADDQGLLAHRCWTLAVLNRNLIQALADCDRAMALNPQDHNVVNSRGFLHYRLGRYEASIADYTHSIEGNPSAGSSFYMRGMARLALRQTEQAQADIAQGEKLQPGVAQRYAGFGVTQASAVAPASAIPGR